MIVDNKPGAGTNVGVQAMVAAAPDGYSLLVVTTASAASAGVGTAPHMAGEMFKAMTGIEMTTCPIAVSLRRLPT